MEIIIKDIKNKEYKIEIESEEVVIKELKNKIKNEFGIELNKIKLLYSGKILNDEKKLKDYNIKENSKLIITSHLVKNNNNNNNKLETTLLSNNNINSENSFKDNNITKEISLSNQNNSNNENYSKNENTNNNNESVINDSNISNNIKDNSKMVEEKKVENNIEEKKQIKSNEKNHIPKELKKYGTLIKILAFKDPNIMTTILNNLKTSNLSLLKLIKEKQSEFIELLEEPISNDDLEIYKKYSQEVKFLLGKEEDKDIKEGKIEIVLTQQENEDIKKLQNKYNINMEDAIEAYIINDKDFNAIDSYILEKRKKEN